MKNLRNIHSISFDALKSKMTLSEVTMKYPLPWRPLRSLGMIRFNGNSYTGERFHRILIMKTTMIRGAVSTVFICPKPEYGMPIFESETMFFGKKTVFFMDVMQTRSSDDSKTSPLYEKLIGIKNKYADELSNKVNPEGRIAEVFSPALCYANISPDSETKIADLHGEYLDAYIEAVLNAGKLERDEVLKAEKDLNHFVNFTTDNDPAMKILYKLYGEEEGRKRSFDLFYGK